MKIEQKVRYSETDMMGVVYHSNYLVWLDSGREAILNSLGYDMIGLDKRGMTFPIAKVTISYKNPVKYGDTITIETHIKKFTKYQTTYSQTIYIKDKIAAKAEIKIAHVSTETFKLMDMKTHLPDVYEKITSVVDKT